MWTLKRDLNKKNFEKWEEECEVLECKVLGSLNLFRVRKFFNLILNK